MGKRAYSGCVALTKFVALVMLSVIMTLLIGRSVHTYVHSTHVCEHSSDCGDEHNHDCKICNFELSLFDRVESLVVTFIVVLISTILVGYIPKNINVNILSRTPRAPPQPII